MTEAHGPNDGRSSEPGLKPKVVKPANRKTKDGQRVSSERRLDYEPTKTLNWFWRWGALVLALLLVPIGIAVVNYGFNIARDSLPATPSETATPAPSGASLVAPSIWIAAGTLIAIAGFALNVANQVKRSRATEKEATDRQKNLTRFNDELTDLIDSVIVLNQSSRSLQAGKQFFQSLLKSARHLTPLEGVRLCVYKFDRRDSEEQEQKSDEFLKLTASSGRGDPPRDDFTPDTTHGEALIQIAHGTRAYPVSDPNDTELAIDWSEDTIWRSFLAIPIRGAEQRHHGVLLIDTRDSTQWTLEHLSIGWTISRFLSVGMDLMNNNIRSARFKRPQIQIQNIQTG